MKPELPQGFVEMIESYGGRYAATLLAALEAPATVSVRANSLKGACPLPDARIVPWCPGGFYLSEKPLFVADPAWHQGLYYVQDASSMVYGEAVRRIVDRCFAGVQGLRYLDACAAPGGKTGCALESLSADAFVVANELDRHRANILMENTARLGATNVAVSSTDACAYGALVSAFDIIAIDAPCSGEGMMRKEPEAVRQWSPALIAECAARQRHIAASLWPALKPGGVMIYSTCTFNRSENEDVAAFIAGELGGEPLDLGLGEYEGVLPGYRFTPGFVEGEGLFIAAFRKSDDGVASAPDKKRKVRGTSALQFRKVSDFSRSVLAAADTMLEFTIGDTLWAVPEAHADFVAAIHAAVGLARPGVRLATAKGRDMVPSQELAWSADLRGDAFPAAELDYRAAMAYLRGEGLSEMPDGLPRGYVAPSFGGCPLGFSKNVGRRANNLYPDAFRLRLDPRYLPDEAPAPIVFSL